MRYSEAFKAKLVKKMTGPGARSANELAAEVGVHQTTLSEWKRKAVVGAGAMAKTKSKRPQDWSAKEKLEAVNAQASLSEEELGGFLRSRGLHQVQLERWREEVLKALQGESRRLPKNSPEKRQIRELERELRRKEKALAETAALLVLQKKARAIWGDEDDVMTPRSER